MASRSNDEMDILNPPDAPAGDATESGAPAAAAPQEDPTIQVKQGDLSVIKTALSQANELLEQYMPSEEEEMGPGEGVEGEGGEEEAGGESSSGAQLNPMQFGGGASNRNSRKL